MITPLMLAAVFLGGGFILFMLKAASLASQNETQEKETDDQEDQETNEDR